MLEKLFTIHNKVVDNYNEEYKRYLFQRINWKSKAICVFGARGVGKTTMLIQYMKENYKSPDKCLYISADNINVIANGLFNIAEEYFKIGGMAIIIDEVHKYPNWSLEIKNIIDTYKNKQILISGSSTLDLAKSKGDLSRRVIYYELKGLSFREYLYLELGEKNDQIAFEDIINDHIDLAMEIKKKLNILEHFRNYLKYGYYPFFIESKTDYFFKVMNVVEKVLFEDIAVVFKLTQAKLPILKKLLWLISTSHPFVPNIEKMSRELGISKEYIYNYLEYLELSGLIISLRKNYDGFKLIRKPGKIFIENTNLINVICGSINIEGNTGSLRETFFVNQISKILKINIAEKGDFVINNTLTFEIGDKNKTFSQIKDLNNAYLALDNIEIGFKNKIPLWIFGFLY